MTDKLNELSSKIDKIRSLAEKIEKNEKALIGEGYFLSNTTESGSVPVGPGFQQVTRGLDIDCGKFTKEERKQIVKVVNSLYKKSQHHLELVELIETQKSNLEKYTTELKELL